MKRTRIVTLAMLLCCCWMSVSSSPLLAESPSVLLERGVFAEETKGDLQQAIDIYKRIISDDQANRVYVAKANYRLAQCYLKKGDKTQAAIYFQKVVSEFASQKDLAAKAANQLRILNKQSSERLPMDVMAHILRQYGNASQQAREKGLHVNTHIYGVDGGFRKYAGGILEARNRTDRPISGEIRLGNFSKENTDFELSNEVGVPQEYRVEDTGRGLGGYSVYWKPDHPIAPGQTRILGYLHRNKPILPKVKDGHRLEMKNRFGAPVLENFFLVIPNGMKIVDKSSDYASKDTVGMFDIYLWQRQVPANTTNRVVLTLGWQGHSYGAPLEMTGAVHQNKSRTKVPFVSRTMPAFLTNDVSPSLKHISVTFDQQMMDSGYSWVNYGRPYPKITGKPRFNTTRTTCRLPVRLEPGKVYWIGINTQPYIGFKSEEGAPATSHVILFATRSKDGKPTPIPQKWIEEANEINSAALRKASTGKPSTEAKERSATISSEAWQLLQRRQYAEAEQKFVKAVQLDSSNENALNGLGWAQFNQGKYRKAKLTFEQCIILNPDHVGALNGLGWIADQQGRDVDAITFWKEAVNVTPHATASLNGLTRTYMKRGDCDNAIKYYQIWLKADPKNEEVKAGLKKASDMKKVVDAAVKEMELWLGFMDRGEYGKSWDAASSKFRNNIQKAEWISMVTAARGRFGKFKSRRRVSAEFKTQLPGAPDAEYVVVVFEAVYEKKAKTIETVTVLKENGAWKGTGYFMR